MRMTIVYYTQLNQETADTKAFLFEWVGCNI